MSKAPWITEQQRHDVSKLLDEGHSLVECARRTKISYSSAKRIRQEDVAWRYGSHIDLPPPLRPRELKKEARRALRDFEYFRRRYMGHISTPWQVATANLIVELLDTPDKEFVVENCPPGVGKTTLLHDVAAWAICRNRRVRGLFGSRTSANANRQLSRLRRSLERTAPMRARSDLKEKGLATDARACLSWDFGRFRPDSGTGDSWRADSIVVLQDDDAPIEEKEPTWSAYGMDQGILGNRFEMILWDDLVDRRVIRSIENTLALEKLWDEELETRLEPGGLLVLVGQRMASRDLYRYCLDKASPVDDEGDLYDSDDLEFSSTAAGSTDGGTGRMYRHIRYVAHDEARCEGLHGRDAPPQPQGCLLDPYRLPWRELRQIARNNADRYRTLYQQEDIDPEGVLVDPVWITGGRDREGVECPGCWDAGRRLWELPPGLAAPVITIVTADPSPTRYWALQCWAWHPRTEQQFLLALERRVMDAPAFLDYDYNRGVFTGLMEDWWQRSKLMGLPIKYWIVEDNAAQRFLLQYDHVRRWAALRGVNIIPHNTNRANKSDPNMGVSAIGPHYRHGRVRLPGAVEARHGPLKLIDEVTRWPGAAKDDQVMAHWFLCWNLRRIHSPHMQTPPRRWTPSWMRNETGVRV